MIWYDMIFKIPDDINWTKNIIAAILFRLSDSQIYIFVCFFSNHKLVNGLRLDNVYRTVLLSFFVIVDLCYCVILGTCSFVPLSAPFNKAFDLHFYITIFFEKKSIKSEREGERMTNQMVKESYLAFRIQYKWEWSALSHAILKYTTCEREHKTIEIWKEIAK